MNTTMSLFEGTDLVSVHGSHHSSVVKVRFAVPSQGAKVSIPNTAGNVKAICFDVSDVLEGSSDPPGATKNRCFRHRRRTNPSACGLCCRNLCDPCSLCLIFNPFAFRLHYYTKAGCRCQGDSGPISDQFYARFGAICCIMC